MSNFIKKCAKEEGVYTVEAAISLTIFMFAYVIIVSLATTARAEGITQYALNQTAKEISQYCYIADRAGFSAKKMKPSAAESEKMNQADDTIEAIGALMNIGSEASDDMAQSLKSGDLSATIKSVQNNATAINGGVQNVFSKVQSFASDNPVASVKLLLTGVGKQAIGNAASRVIGIALCKMLMPKYITSDTAHANEALEKLGIEGGMNGINFGMSTVLWDGRSINLVCIYQIKLPGLLGERHINVQQSASTAAWYQDVSLEEAADSVPSGSIWNEGSYGSKFVSLYKSENEGMAVKSGIGIDGYRQSENTFVEIHAMNVFSKSYSEIKKDADGTSQDSEKSESYTLNVSKVKSTMKSYANTLNNNVQKTGDTITMENGTQLHLASENRKKELVMYIPEEAAANSEIKQELENIAGQIQSEMGVKVVYQYKDKVFTVEK